MARQGDERDSDIVNTSRPSQCRLHGAAADNPPSDQASALGLVDWAGLPADLDMAFSRSQRDKVYAQHLIRKRRSRLWRRSQDDGEICGCGSADDQERQPEPAEPTPSR